MDGLKERARSGALWMALAVGASAIVQVLRIVVLARFFLGPSDFGLVAVAIAVVYVLAAVADLGTSSSILHRQDATREQISSVFWFNVLLGVVLCVLVAVTAPTVARLLGEPDVGPLLRVLAVCFVLDGVATPLIVLLRRDLEFRRASLAEAISVLVSSAVTLLWALMGAGLWSLVAGVVCQTLVRALLLMRWAWPRFDMLLRLRFDDLRGFLGFGAYQVAERLVGRVGDRIGQLLLEPLAGSVQLGLYSVASNLATMPMLQILPIIGQTTTPVLSMTQSDPQRMARGYFLACEVLMTIMAPMFLGMMVIAPTLVPFLLGEKWAEAVPIFQVLCLSTLCYAFFFFSGSLIIAKGRGALGLAFRAGLTVATIGPAAVGAHYGQALGLSIGIAAISALAIAPYYVLVLRRILGPCLREFVGALCAPVLIGAVMAVVVYLVGGLLDDWRTLAVLAVQILVGGVVYAGLVLALRPTIARELMAVLPVAKITAKIAMVRSSVRQA